VPISNRFKDCPSFAEIVGQSRPIEVEYAGISKLTGRRCR